jgi:hypothetical protein
MNDEPKGQKSISEYETGIKMAGGLEEDLARQNKLSRLQPEIKLN